MTEISKNAQVPQCDKTAVIRSFFFDILSGRNVTYFSTETTGDFNWQGLQDKINYSEGIIEKSEFDELILKDGMDEYVLDFEDYVGKATDENDDIIENSFFFLDSHLVVVLK